MEKELIFQILGIKELKDELGRKGWNGPRERAVMVLGAEWTLWLHLTRSVVGQLQTGSFTWGCWEPEGPPGPWARMRTSFSVPLFFNIQIKMLKGLTLRKGQPVTKRTEDSWDSPFFLFEALLQAATCHGPRPPHLTNSALFPSSSKVSSPHLIWDTNPNAGFRIKACQC